MSLKYDFDITAATLEDANNTVSLQLGMVGRDKDVLELGCATGRVTRLLVEQHGCRVTGVEYDAGAAERARPFCQRLVIGDVLDEATLAAAAGEYDVILAGDVLEHLRAPELALRALRPSLRPGGCWVISVPNIAHWSVRKELLRGRFDYTDTGVMDRTHLRWFTPSSLGRLLADSGYRVVQARAVTTLPLQDALKLRRLAAWLGRRRIAPGLLGIQLVVQAAPAGAVVSRA